MAAALCQITTTKTSIVLHSYQICHYFLLSMQVNEYCVGYSELKDFAGLCTMSVSTQDSQKDIKVVRRQTALQRWTLLLNLQWTQLRGLERQRYSESSTLFKIYTNIYFTEKAMRWGGSLQESVIRQLNKYWKTIDHFCTKFIKMFRRMNLKNHVANSNFNSDHKAT